MSQGDMDSWKKTCPTSYRNDGGIVFVLMRKEKKTKTQISHPFQEFDIFVLFVGVVVLESTFGFEKIEVKRN